MKIGLRKPSIKKSISARTTGKLKRKIKKSINPLYGKKGMGYINNPKKALYNKVYNKTTFGVTDILNSKYSSSNSSVNNNKNFERNEYSYPGVKQKNKWITLALCVFLGVIGVHKFYEEKTALGILYLFTGGLFGIGIIVDILSIIFKPNYYYV